MLKPFLREIEKCFCCTIRVQSEIYLEELIAWIFEGICLNPKGTVGNGIKG